MALICIRPRDRQKLPLGTRAGSPVPLAIYLIPFRTALFLAVVLIHGLRRLLPP
ncbi:MAG: ADP-ribosylglycohydrolase family protein, partial [Gammaproteobacteria bacterium]